MKLYLVQHALSFTKQEDSDRSLTPQGTEIVKKIGQFAQNHITPQITCIFHSEKKRSQQTAEILATILHPEVGVRKSQGLNPMDDPKIWFTKMKDLEDEIMIVGHLPHLEHLTQLLLQEDEDRAKIRFQNAGIVCLEKYPDHKWVINLEILPDMVKG